MPFCATFIFQTGPSVYNPCFYEGTSGWEIEGSSSVQETDTGNHFLNLSAGSILRQHEVAGYQDFQPGEKITLQFEITSNTPATVTAQVGTESESLAVSGNGTYQLEFTASDSGCDLSIGTDQDIDIDNIYLFNAVQCGKVYDAFGNEEECCDALRQMNKSISKKLAYKGFSLVSQFDQAEKAGVANADNPWNTNLTCITVPETGATAVYMMPGTELTYTIHVTEDQSSISFSGSLYSQAVAWKVSDGAVVAIQLTNETGEELLSQNLNIAADGTATFFTYDLSPYIGSTVQLHLSCNGGPSENCDGDWVILQNAA